jgi:hypothetical protein
VQNHIIAFICNLQKRKKIHVQNRKVTYVQYVKTSVASLCSTNKFMNSKGKPV